MSTYSDLLSYYANLLIAQFNGQPKASATIEQLVSGIVMGDGQGNTLPLDVLNGFNLNATIQTLDFSAVPASGSFAIGYGSAVSVAIPAAATADNLQAAFQGLLGPKAASLAGTPASQSVIVSFQTIPNPQTLYIATNTLHDGSGSAITITVSTNVAMGQQLDWLGKYAGVVRAGVGANGQSITLSDSDFFLLIQLAIVQNNSGSSLATIQAFLAQFFPGVIQVFDYANSAPMQMSYLINTSTLSNNLIQLAIAEGLLPVPMAVELSIIGAPVINQFFAFSDASVNGGSQSSVTTPFNCNASYTSGAVNASYEWVDYSDGL